MRVTPNGSVITQVCRGTTVYVYGIVCQCGVYWYQVRFYGGVGYIRADLVTACTYSYPSSGCGTGMVGKSGGINYYDYSNKSTTIITENPPAGPSCGSVMPDTSYGYNTPSSGYADPSYGMSGSAGDFGKALGDTAPGQTYFPDAGSYSPEAASLPAPAAQPASLCFTTCSLSVGQTLPVYTAPNTESLRADSGTAQVTLTESIYAAGFDGQWLLVMYRNQDKMTRVGYLNAFQLQGTLPSMASIAFGTQQVMASCRTAVTSDPMEQTDALLMLNSGDTVTLLATLNLNGQWAYVETMYNGVIVRGFVPADAVRVSTDRIEQG
ncbi:MAG: SH3 domain-containing protein [Eubacterium sp.]|nr:SH3 domain-containing protein [Eubacterium sp.]